MQNESGINEEKLNKLILDIYNYSEKINKTLNQISEVVDKTKKIYSSKEADLYRSKYENFRVNYVNVIKNINRYAEDLILVKQKYSNFDINASKRVLLEKIDLGNFE